ncbi:MAG TPA: phosphatase PAP2 family protein, partial [Flavisolibacter sp.]|nr:phosphatase PAP2 family protein [Flavisolibacter sp.]
MKKLVLLAGMILAMLKNEAQIASVSDSLNGQAPAEPLLPNARPAAEPVYRLKPAVDIPLTAVAAGWSGFAFTKIYNKDRSTPAEIMALDKNDLASYNRHGADVYYPKAADASDILFYGSMPLPLLLLADKEIRKDAGKVGFLYLEAMSITGLLYTGSVYFVDKYRPYVYNPETPMDKRLGGGGKNSFFAGHVALVGTSTFFMAKVLSDYHPESRAKWAFFSAAGLATGATAYLRYRAGQHFLDDLIIGTAVGTLSGILVPHLHKNKSPRSTGLSLSPVLGRQQGL